MSETAQVIHYFTNVLIFIQGFYDTQDVGWISAEGAVWVVARTDDVINVAGHRLSTAAIEDVVLKHARVADAIVVGAPDQSKGDVPLCLYVMRPPQDGKLLRSPCF